MFDNVNWNEIINNILSYIEEDWKYLMIKAVASQASYSTKFYYSKNNNEFIDLYGVIDREQVLAVGKVLIFELRKMIKEKFNYSNEIMFLTIKVENTGNVKVIYRDIKEGNKLPWDEINKYLKLNENDKIMWSI